MIFSENDAVMAPGIDNEIIDINEITTRYDDEVSGVAPEAPSKTEPSSWTYIRHLQVFSAWGGNVLYANGFQQMKLVVVVQVVDDENKVTAITDAERDSIQLVDADSGEALVIDHFREGDEPGWKCSLERFPNIEPYPHRGNLEKPSIAVKDMIVKVFYVSSNSLEPITLIPAITHSDGTVFSGDEKADYGHITLRAVPPPTYRKEHFRLLRLSPYSQGTEHVAKVERYILDLISDQLHIKFVECSLSGVLQARSDHPDYLGYYAVGYFHGSKVNHWEEIEWETADQYADSKEEPGKAVFLMHFAKKGGRSQVRYDRPTVKFFARDMYGNTHTINLSLNVDNPSIIEII